MSVEWGNGPLGTAPSTNQKCMPTKHMALCMLGAQTCVNGHDIWLYMEKFTCIPGYLNL